MAAPSPFEPSGAGISVGAGVSAAGSKTESGGIVPSGAGAAVVGVDGDAAFLALLSLSLLLPAGAGVGDVAGFAAWVVVVVGGGSGTSMGRIDVGAVVVVGPIVVVVDAIVVVVVDEVVGLVAGGTVGSEALTCIVPVISGWNES